MLRQVSNFRQNKDENNNTPNAHSRGSLSLCECTFQNKFITDFITTHRGWFYVFIMLFMRINAPAFVSHFSEMSESLVGGRTICIHGLLLPSIWQDSILPSS